MAKQAAIKKTKINVKPKSFLLPAILAIIFVILLINGILTSYLIKQEYKQANYHIGGLILSAVDNLNHPLPIEASTGKVYFSNDRLTLPPVPILQLNYLEYRSFPANNDMAAEINLVSQSDVIMAKGPIQAGDSKLETIFEAVPKLQACARGITIRISEPNAQQAAAQKVLSNGKTVYFYTEPLCPNAELLEYAKLIESY